jgi:hypothetical protein
MLVISISPRDNDTVILAGTKDGINFKRSRWRARREGFNETGYFHCPGWGTVSSEFAPPQKKTKISRQSWVIQARMPQLGAEGVQQRSVGVEGALGGQLGGGSRGHCVGGRWANMLLVIRWPQSSQLGLSNFLTFPKLLAQFCWFFVCFFGYLYSTTSLQSLFI